MYVYCTERLSYMQFLLSTFCGGKFYFVALNAVLGYYFCNFFIFSTLKRQITGECGAEKIESCCLARFRDGFSKMSPRQAWNARGSHEQF